MEDANDSGEETDVEEYGWSVLVIMHGRSVPLHAYKAGTEHVGFSSDQACLEGGGVHPGSHRSILLPEAPHLCTFLPCV